MRPVALPAERFLRVPPEGLVEDRALDAARAGLRVRDDLVDRLDVTNRAVRPDDAVFQLAAAGDFCRVRREAGLDPLPVFRVREAAHELARSHRGLRGVEPDDAAELVGPEIGARLRPVALETSHVGQRLRRQQVGLDLVQPDFRGHALADVADDADEARHAFAVDLADGHLGREDRAVLAAGLDLARREHEPGLAGLLVALDVVVVVGAEWRRHQQGDVLADDLPGAVAEDTLRARVERLDDAVAVDQHDRVRRRVQERGELVFRTPLLGRIALDRAGFAGVHGFDQNPVRSRRGRAARGRPAYGELE